MQSILLILALTATLEETSQQLIERLEAGYPAHYERATGVAISGIDCATVHTSDYGAELACEIEDAEGVRTRYLVQMGSSKTFEYLVTDFAAQSADAKRYTSAPINALAAAFQDRDWSALYRSEHIAESLRSQTPEDQFAQIDSFANLVGAVQSIRVRESTPLTAGDADYLLVRFELEGERGRLIGMVTLGPTESGQLAIFQYSLLPPFDAEIYVDELSNLVAADLAPHLDGPVRSVTADWARLGGFATPAKGTVETESGQRVEFELVNVAGRFEYAPDLRIFSEFDP
ncbi:MAG: hypothetical protein AAGE01_21275 [Pseudomonadota bacterium]